MSERTFVALGLPSEPRARLAAATAWLRGQSPGLRPTAPDTWHLTLAFLGPLDEDGQHAVAGHLARVVARAASAPAPWLELDRAGRFGDRVLYVAVRDEPAGRLAALVDALRADLAEAGFARPTTGFQAHITLARSRRGRPVTRADVDAVRVPAARWQPATIGVWATARPGTAAAYEVRAEVAWPGG